MKASVHIPKSHLRVQLDEAVAIKREMAQLLRELEQTATGRPVANPGVWRHHPTAYLKRIRSASERRTNETGRANESDRSPESDQPPT